jgi:phage N-6-adenine-methyltransferase
MNSALMFSKASDEWSTPQAFFNALAIEFRFVMDVAATAANTKCRHWFGPDSQWAPDALTVDWSTRGASFMNPPYSRCREFIAKAAREAARGCVVVALVPSRTDTRWWHDHVWDVLRHRPRPGVDVRFVKGRLTFGGASASAPFPSVVIVFRGDTRVATPLEKIVPGASSSVV